jgi:hypothetical protein
VSSSLSMRVRVLFLTATAAASRCPLLHHALPPPPGGTRHHVTSRRAPPPPPNLLGWPMARAGRADVPQSHSHTPTQLVAHKCFGFLFFRVVSPWARLSSVRSRPIEACILITLRQGPVTLHPQEAVSLPPRAKDRRDKASTTPLCRHSLTERPNRIQFPNLSLLS